MVPATFVGKRRINKNIRNLWSLTFDLDDVTPSNLENLIYMIIMKNKDIKKNQNIHFNI